jgi:hypothetical protein
VNKKRLLMTNLISVLLLSAVAGTLFVNLGRANPTPIKFDSPPIISVYSPTNNTSINVNEVLLNFSVTKPGVSWDIRIGGPDWTISGRELQSVRIHVDSNLYEFIAVDSNLSSPFNHFVYLTNLTDGEHNVVIHAYALAYEMGGIFRAGYRAYPVSDPSIMQFTVDTTSPTVTVLELENKEFIETAVPLNFTVNEPVSKISYALDGQENVTIAGNCTIPNLPYGEHSIIVFATDEMGNTGTSETINFNVEVPEPSSTELVPVVSVASAGIIALSLLVYFKKRKHSAEMVGSK